MKYQLSFLCDCLQADNEQLQSNNNLLQVRLSSLLAMFGIQEAAAKEVSLHAVLYATLGLIYTCRVVMAYYQGKHLYHI